MGKRSRFTGKSALLQTRHGRSNASAARRNRRPSPHTRTPAFAHRQAFRGRRKERRVRRHPCTGRRGGLRSLPLQNARRTERAAAMPRRRLRDRSSIVRRPGRPCHNKAWDSDWEPPRYSKRRPRPARENFALPRAPDAFVQRKTRPALPLHHDESEGATLGNAAPDIHCKPRSIGSAHSANCCRRPRIGSETD